MISFASSVFFGKSKDQRRDSQSSYWLSRSTSKVYDEIAVPKNAFSPSDDGRHLQYLWNIYYTTRDSENGARDLFNFVCALDKIRSKMLTRSSCDKNMHGHPTEVILEVGSLFLKISSTTNKTILSLLFVSHGRDVLIQCDRPSSLGNMENRAQLLRGDYIDPQSARRTQYLACTKALCILADWDDNCIILSNKFGERFAETFSRLIPCFTEEITERCSVMSSGYGDWLNDTAYTIRLLLYMVQMVTRCTRPKIVMNKVESIQRDNGGIGDGGNIFLPQQPWSGVILSKLGFVSCDEDVDDSDETVWSHLLQDKAAYLDEALSAGACGECDNDASSHHKNELHRHFCDRYHVTVDLLHLVDTLSGILKGPIDNADGVTAGEVYRSSLVLQIEVLNALVNCLCAQNSSTLLYDGAVGSTGAASAGDIVSFVSSSGESSRVVLASVLLGTTDCHDKIKLLDWPSKGVNMDALLVRRGILVLQIQEAVRFFIVTLDSLRHQAAWIIGANIVAQFFVWVAVTFPSSRDYEASVSRSATIKYKIPAEFPISMIQPYLECREFWPWQSSSVEPHHVGTRADKQLEHREVKVGEHTAVCDISLSEVEDEAPPYLLCRRCNECVPAAPPAAMDEVTASSAASAYGKVDCDTKRCMAAWNGIFSVYFSPYKSYMARSPTVTEAVAREYCKDSLDYFLLCAENFFDTEVLPSAASLSSSWTQPPSPAPSNELKMPIASGYWVLQLHLHMFFRECLSSFAEAASLAFHDSSFLGFLLDARSLRPAEWVCQQLQMLLSRWHQAGNTMSDGVGAPTVLNQAPVLDWGRMHVSTYDGDQGDGSRVVQWMLLRDCVFETLTAFFNACMSSIQCKGTDGNYHTVLVALIDSVSAVVTAGTRRLDLASLSLVFQGLQWLQHSMEQMSSRSCSSSLPVGTWRKHRIVLKEIRRKLWVICCHVVSTVLPFVRQNPVEPTFALPCLSVAIHFIVDLSNDEIFMDMFMEIPQHTSREEGDAAFGVSPLEDIQRSPGCLTPPVQGLDDIVKHRNVLREMVKTKRFHAAGVKILGRILKYCALNVQMQQSADTVARSQQLGCTIANIYLSCLGEMLRESGGDLVLLTLSALAGMLRLPEYVSIRPYLQSFFAPGHSLPAILSLMDRAVAGKLGKPIAWQGINVFMAIAFGNDEMKLQMSTVLETTTNKPARKNRAGVTSVEPSSGVSHEGIYRILGAAGCLGGRRNQKETVMVLFEFLLESPLGSTVTATTAATSRAGSSDGDEGSEREGNEGSKTEDELRPLFNSDVDSYKIANMAAMSMLFGVLPMCDKKVQRFILLSLLNLVQGSSNSISVNAVINLAVCAQSRRSAINLCLDLFEEIDDDIQEDCVTLLQALGSHSMSVPQLKHLLRSMKQTSDGDKLHNWRILKALRGMISDHCKPRHSFVFEGTTSGLFLPPLVEWPPHKPFAVCTWLRVEQAHAVHEGITYEPCILSARSLETKLGLSVSLVRQAGRESFEVVVRYFTVEGSDVATSTVTVTVQGSAVRVGQWHFLGISFDDDGNREGSCRMVAVVDQTIFRQTVAFTKISGPRLQISFGDVASKLSQSGTNSCFRGQMGCIYILSSPTEDQLLNIQSLGPSYSYNFESFTSEYQGFNGSVAQCLNGSMERRVVVAFNPGFVIDCIASDTSPDRGTNMCANFVQAGDLSRGSVRGEIRKLNATLSKGTFTAEYRDVRISLFSLGGLNVLFPLFFQAESSPSLHVSPRICGRRLADEEARAQLLMELMALLVKLLETLPNHQRIHHKLASLEYIGYCLERVSTQNLTEKFVEQLVKIFEALSWFQTLQSKMLEFIFCNFKIWRRCSKSVQQSVLLFLRRYAVGSFEIFRETIGVQKLLLALRVHFEYEAGTVSDIQGELELRTGRDELKVEICTIDTFRQEAVGGGVDAGGAEAAILENGKPGTHDGSIHHGSIHDGSVDCNPIDVVELTALRQLVLGIIKDLIHFPFPFVEKDINDLVIFIVTVKSHESKLDGISVLLGVFQLASMETFVLRSMLHANVFAPFLRLTGSSSARIRLYSCLLIGCMLVESKGLVEIPQGEVELTLSVTVMDSADTCFSMACVMSAVQENLCLSLEAAFDNNEKCAGECEIIATIFSGICFGDLKFRSTLDDIESISIITSSGSAFAATLGDQKQLLHPLALLSLIRFSLSRCVCSALRESIFAMAINCLRDCDSNCERLLSLPQWQGVILTAADWAARNHVQASASSRIVDSSALAAHREVQANIRQLTSILMNTSLRNGCLRNPKYVEGSVGNKLNQMVGKRNKREVIKDISMGSRRVGIVLLWRAVLWLRFQSTSIAFDNTTLNAFIDASGDLISRFEEGYFTSLAEGGNELLPPEMQDHVKKIGHVNFWLLVVTMTNLIDHEQFSRSSAESGDDTAKVCDCVQRLILTSLEHMRDEVLVPQLSFRLRSTSHRHSMDVADPVTDRASSLSEGLDLVTPQSDLIFVLLRLTLAAVKATFHCRDFELSLFDQLRYFLQSPELVDTPLGALETLNVIASIQEVLARARRPQEPNSTRTLRTSTATVLVAELTLQYAQLIAQSCQRFCKTAQGSVVAILISQRSEAGVETASEVSGFETKLDSITARFESSETDSHPNISEFLPRIILSLLSANFVNESVQDSEEAPISLQMWQTFMGAVRAEAELVGGEWQNKRLRELGLPSTAMMTSTIAQRCAEEQERLKRLRENCNRGYESLCKINCQYLDSDARAIAEYRSRGSSHLSAILFKVRNERGPWGDGDGKVYWTVDDSESGQGTRWRLKRNEQGSSHNIATKLMHTHIIHHSDLTKAREDFARKQDLLKYKKKLLADDAGGAEAGSDEESSTKILQTESEWTASTASTAGASLRFRLMDSFRHSSDRMFSSAKRASESSVSGERPRFSSSIRSGGGSAVGLAAPSRAVGKEVLFRASAEIVSKAPYGICGCTRGWIDLYPSKIVFICDETEQISRNNFPRKAQNEQVAWALQKFPSTTWLVKDVWKLQQCYHLLQMTAIQLFVASRTSVFVNFFKYSVAKEFFRIIVRELRPPYLLTVKEERKPERTMTRSAAITEAWRERKISNFDYLMYLNSLAGRSFDNLEQYPVFPWVLSDYSSSKIDLKDPKYYRDLQMPIGAQTEATRNARKKKYEESREIYESDSTTEYVPYHSATHYSTMAFVTWYLVRMEPFTSLHIAFQSDRFDITDRQFISLQGAWDAATTERNMELIPEFFYMPEILENVNDIDLGTRQNGQRVGSVVLPPWARGDAFEFVRINREALESDHVSMNLHHWIDLIFGFKQRPPTISNGHLAAIEALNVYTQISYIDAVQLEVMKEADLSLYESTISKIRNFGQTPVKLFQKEHAARYAIDDYQNVKIVWPFASVALPSQPCFQGIQHIGSSALGLHTVRRGVKVPRPRAILSYPVIHTTAASPIIALELYQEQLIAVDCRGAVTVCSFVMRPMFETPPFVTVQEGDPEMTPKRSVITWATDKQRVSKSKGSGAGGKNVSQGNGNVGGAGSASRTIKYIGDDLNPHQIAFLPEAKFIFSCGHGDSTFKVTHLDSGELLQSVLVHSDVVTCLGLVADFGQHWLVSGSRDCTAMVWEVHPERAGRPVVSQPLHVLVGHDDAVTCVAVNAALDIVVTGSDDGTLIIHSLREGLYIRSLVMGNLHNDRLMSSKRESQSAVGVVELVQFRVRLVSIGSDATVAAYCCSGLSNHLSTLTVNGRLLGHIAVAESVRCMAVSQDGQVLITGGEIISDSSATPVSRINLRFIRNLKPASGKGSSRMDLATELTGDDIVNSKPATDDAGGSKRGREVSMTLNCASGSRNVASSCGAVCCLKLLADESLLLVGLQNGKVRALTQDASYFRKQLVSVLDGLGLPM